MAILSKSRLLDYVASHRSTFDAQDNPFSGTDWLLHWIRVVGEDTQYVVAEHGEAQAKCVMLLQKQGSALRALTNYYASLYSPLAGSTQHRVAAAGSLARQVRALRPSSVTFAPMDSEDAALLAGAFAGWYSKPYFCFGNYHLPCSGLKFDDYMNARPSQLQNTWVRKRKKFPGRLEIITGREGLERGIEAYQRIYAESWKQAEPYADFVPGWLRICGERGMLRLGVAWLGDVPIAAQFWFVWRERAYIYKLAYDEQHARHSAGTLLSAELFRHALDTDRVMEIDYLTGDDDYKKSWMHERRERRGLLACNLSTPRGALRALYERVGSMRRRRAAA